MELIRTFSRLGKNDASIAGGKGASLGEMTQAGIPVPPGFVILTDSFEQFIKETHLVSEIDSILHKVKHNEISTVESASEKIQALILAAEMPKDIALEIKKSFKKLGAKYVAVRSSATAEDSSAAAWAGQLDSYLNTTENMLLEKVKHCWASLFTPRAIFYRFEKGMHKTKISVAVVVQKMVESEVSGIAFSVHPVTQDRNQVIIEGGYGLGEAIVSGQITPDSYVIEKQPRRIIDKNISEQQKGLYKVEKGGNEWKSIGERGKNQKLSDAQVLELTKIILGIENHYNFPCDIEWAYEKSKFYIVQSRPITTLTDKKTEIKNADPFSEFMYLPEGGRSNYFYFQYGAARIMDPKHKYWPLKTAFLTNTKEHVSKWYIVAKSVEDFYNALNVFVKDKNRLTKIENYITSEREIIFKKLVKTDVKKLTNNQLNGLMQFYFEHYLNLLRTAGTLRFLDRGLVLKMQKDFSKFGNGDDLIRHASVSERKSFPLQEEIALAKLAVKLKKTSKKTYLKEEMKGIENIKNSFCWSVCGYYNEKPKTNEIYANQLKDMVSKNPEKLLKELEHRHEFQVEERHKHIKVLDKSAKVLADLASASSYMKDYYKSSVSKVIYAVEPLFTEIAKRCGKSIDFVKDLLPSETELLLKGKKLDEASINLRTKHAIVVPINNELHILTGKQADEFEKKYLTVTSSGQTEFKGRAACPGLVRGTVKVVLNQKDFGKLKKGEILVVHNTSPDFVPILKTAGAIVAEEGGITAHVSVISREMGIPCVVGIAHIPSLLKDGDQVEVNANTGIIKILKKA